MEQPYLTHYDQISPPHSFTDHVSEKAFRNTDSFSRVSEVENDVNIPERLTRLLHLASQNTEMRRPDSEALHHCLDTLEALLDPRSSLTQEIVRCRPQNTYSRPTRIDTLALASKHADPVPKITFAQLAALRDDVITLSIEFNRRRSESNYIYDLFAQDRQKLEQRVSELEAEINELKSDMVEDSAEREALQGTVRGLESWIEGWQMQHDLTVRKNLNGRSLRGERGWWTKRKPEQPRDSDTEGLLEGILAWMRGWQDAQEGVRNRQKVREMRRDGKQCGQVISESRESFTS